MQSKGIQFQFTGQHVYVGMDVALRSWSVSIFFGQSFHKSLSIPPDPDVLMRYLKRMFPGATYHSVYEAGYFGFWIHTALVNLGVDNIVVNPADVPTSDKERRTKTDRVYSFKLGRSLALGELRGIYVPERLAQEDRSLVRMRATFVRKQTRCKCQIKSLLRYYNIKHPDDLSDRYWSGNYVRWLESLTLEQESGTQALSALIQELLTLRARIAELTKQIHRLTLQDRYRDNITLLKKVSGISLMAATIFLAEVITIDRFKNLDRLSSFVGLVPGKHSTGETDFDTGLTPRRNSALRYILIECAWIAQREDPVLLEAFNKYCARMPKNVAIVHIAKKLLSRMRYVLIHQQPYATGVMKNG